VCFKCVFKCALQDLCRKLHRKMAKFDKVPNKVSDKGTRPRLLGQA
jgi:hypothetical protein